MNISALPADFPYPAPTSPDLVLFRRPLRNLSMRHRVAYCLCLNLSVASAEQYADGDPDFTRTYTRVVESLSPRFSSEWQDKIATRDGVPALYARFNRNRARFGLPLLK